GPVKEGRFVDVVGLIGDEPEADLAGSQLGGQLLGQQVGGHGAAHAAADDDDVLHGVLPPCGGPAAPWRGGGTPGQRAFCTTKRVAPSSSSSAARSLWPALATQSGMSTLDP